MKLPHPDWRPLIEEAERQGWCIERYTKHGIRLRAPWGKHTVSLASTPGDVRTWRNAVSDMRRLGLIWPRRR